MSNRIPPSSSIVKIAEQRGLSPAAEKARLGLKQEYHNSLNVPNPEGPNIENFNLDYNAEGSRIDLPVDDISFYDNNPRLSANPLFAEIKESIRENGILSPLVVTRKPDTKQYFLEAVHSLI
jgi:hypothetical protein